MMHRFQNLKQHHLGIGLLLAVGVISFWRGVWQLSDIFLFPENRVISNTLSMLIGAGVIYAIYRFLDKNAADRL